MMRFAILIVNFALLLTTLVINCDQLIAQTRRQIIIEQADEWRNLKKDGIEIRRLLGNVILRHDNVRMKCDSAYEYTGSNRFDAFGNVVIYQETTTLYGDTLYYDGIGKRGRVRGKIVKLVDEDATLITRYLDFDTQLNSANYYNGGIITNSNSHFSSTKGVYFSNQKKFIFSRNVAYKGDDMLINTDSLEYSTDTEVIFFFGPTRVYNEENYLYSEIGWHNRKENKSQFSKNAYVNNETQRIFGDRIFYDRENGIAEIHDNGCVIDSSRNLTLFGDEIRYNEKTELAKATKDPLAISISDQGDTLYLRANYIIGKAIKDTIHTDSTLYRLMKGIGDVRFFRDDLQGVCDSMVFNSKDSILYMYIDPILWNDANQLTADSISVLFKNENIHLINFIGSAFICSQEDSIRFNQIKGREMIGYFANNNLTRLDVNGNGETVYFARDKGVISFVNRAESSSLSINIRENQVSSIMFRDKPTGKLSPIDKVELQDVMLKGFAWHLERRPSKKEDVIPKHLNLNFYIPIEEKANHYKLLRKNPAESL